MCSLSGINNTPFHRHQQETTAWEYANTLARLLAMLLRTQGEYRFTLSGELKDGLAAFRQALITGDGEVHKLHAVLMVLWKQRWTPTAEDPLSCPTHRFLCLLSLQADGAHGDANMSTRPIAQLKYLIRVAFLNEIHTLARNKGQETLDEALQECEQWFRDKTHFPFGDRKSVV